jgi:hypothetical protein
MNAIRRAFKDRPVAVLHKLKNREETKEGVAGELAAGQTFRFPSGDAYIVADTGAVVNAAGKPYKGKKQRKLWKKLRRIRRIVANSEPPEPGSGTPMRELKPVCS